LIRFAAWSALTGMVALMRALGDAEAQRELPILRIAGEAG
jgi:hypothetical protein